MEITQELKLLDHSKDYTFVNQMVFVKISCSLIKHIEKLMVMLTNNLMVYGARKIHDQLMKNFYIQKLLFDVHYGQIVFFVRIFGKYCWEAVTKNSNRYRQMISDLF